MTALYILPCSKVSGSGASVCKQCARYVGNVLVLPIRIVECPIQVQSQAECEYQHPPAPPPARAGGGPKQRVSQDFAKYVYSGGTCRVHVGRRNLQACKTGPVRCELCFCLPFSCLLLPELSFLAHSQLLFMAVVFKLQFANDQLGSLLQDRFLRAPSPPLISNSVALGGVWKMAFPPNLSGPFDQEGTRNRVSGTYQDFMFPQTRLRIDTSISFKI